MSLLDTALGGLRTVTFVSVFTLVQILAFALVPVSFLNPILRRIGLSEDKMPMNFVLPRLAECVLRCCGVWVSVENRAATCRTRVIFMYNHTSNLDPIIVQSVAATKFVYKKELKYVPIFGWVMYLYNNISIDRKHREKAIQSLNRAVKRVVEKQQNVAISPEGTRSKSGQLMDFKKGPFHMAIQAEARIVPVVIEGAHDLLPPKSLLLAGGAVRVTLLEPIEVTRETDSEELRQQLHSLFEEHLRNGRVLPLPKYNPILTAAPALAIAAVSLGLAVNLWRKVL